MSPKTCMPCVQDLHEAAEDLANTLPIEILHSSADDEQVYLLLVVVRNAFCVSCLSSYYL